jgi:hypothetical protein
MVQSERSNPSVPERGALGPSPLSSPGKEGGKRMNCRCTPFVIIAGNSNSIPVLSFLPFSASRDDEFRSEEA